MWDPMVYNGKCPCPGVIPTAWECRTTFLSCSPFHPAHVEQSHVVGTKKILRVLPFASLMPLQHLQPCHARCREAHKPDVMLFTWKRQCVKMCLEAVVTRSMGFSSCVFTACVHAHAVPLSCHHLKRDCPLALLSLAASAVQVLGLPLSCRLMSLCMCVFPEDGGQDL